MQKGVVWICEQPADQYTGNIEFDDALVEKQGL